jgi:hypothetical protein
MSIPEARNFLNNVDGLTIDQKFHLKQLLNKGIIIPSAVIGSLKEDLLEIIELNPVKGNKCP